jgi:hypothetical protein
MAPNLRSNGCSGPKSGGLAKGSGFSGYSARSSTEKIMSGDAYLRGLLQTYAVNGAGAQAAANQLFPILQHWGNGYLLGAEFSGSLAKGTAVSVSTDADVFLSVSAVTPGTLADMYNTLCTAVSGAGYPVRRQDVSVGTKVNGYSIDLVPARRQSQYGDEHSLFRNRTGSWTKTDAQRHISLVSRSGRTNEIKILKLWRCRHNLQFPSFYLELAVIGTLHYARVGDLAANVWRALEHFRDNIASTIYIDPANTNNVVSDDCSAAEKTCIAMQAASSLSKRTWQEVVW